MQGSGVDAKFHEVIVAHIRDVLTFPALFFFFFFLNTWITTALLTKC